MTLIKPERFTEKEEKSVQIPRTKEEIEKYINTLPQPVGYRILIKLRLHFSRISLEVL